MHHGKAHFSGGCELHPTTVAPVAAKADRGRYVLQDIASMSATGFSEVRSRGERLGESNRFLKETLDF